MNKRNVTHNKVKNTGILFEQLVRQITADTLAGKSNSPALSIMSKYFKSTTELGKELQLYRSFFQMAPLSEVKSAQFVDLVAGQFAKLNTKKLAEEKYELIKEIKNSYDLKDFLSVKIPSYKIYASIYKTFLAETNNIDITDIQEIAQSRFTLMEHLIKKNSSSVATSESRINEVFKNQSEDLRLLSYKIMLDKFNQKYSNLQPKQKLLLREYINSVSNSDKFVSYVKNEIVPLKKELLELAGNEKDRVIQIKLNEVASQLDRIRGKNKIRDNELTAMMVAYQIVQELKT